MRYLFSLLICCFLSQISVDSYAQHTSQPYIFGTVTDIYGTPLSGAKISDVSHHNTVYANDFDGDFHMDVPGRDFIMLQISHDGYFTEMRKMWLDHGQLREINIMLRPDDLLRTTGVRNVLVASSAPRIIAKPKPKNPPPPPPELWPRSEPKVAKVVYKPLPKSKPKPKPRIRLSTTLLDILAIGSVVEKAQEWALASPVSMQKAMKNYMFLSKDEVKAELRKRKRARKKARKLMRKNK